MTVWGAVTVNTLFNLLHVLCSCYRDRPKLVFFDLTECVGAATQLSTSLFSVSCPTKQVCFTCYSCIKGSRSHFLQITQ